jgi:hypothetical protein
MLGQSVVYEPVRQLARFVGKALKRFSTVAIQPDRTSFSTAA